MKTNKSPKYLLYFFSVVLFLLSVNNSYSQCGLVQEDVILLSGPSNFCSNSSPSITINIYLEYRSTTGYVFKNVNVCRPDGSIAMVLTSSNTTYISDGARQYVFSAGYFNIPGTWSLTYTTVQSCSGIPIGKSMTLKSIGIIDNVISSNEIICNGGGVPGQIFNNALYSNSPTGISSISWYSSPGGLIAGATGVDYAPVYINATTTYYRSVTTNEGCIGSSNTVTKTVYSTLVAGAISVSQNNCYNVAPSQLTQITSTSGGSGTYTYQWYVSTDGSSFSEVTGATGVNYQPSFQLGIRYFKRRDYDLNCGSSYTNTVTVFGYPPLSVGTITADQTICYNITPGSLNVGTAANGGTGSYSYQWEVSSDGSSFGDISGATGTTYQPPALTSSRWYRLKVINSCETGYTGSVKITVHNPLSQGTVTADQTICYNITPSILSVGTSATGGSGTYTYQWQISTDGSVFGDISGQNGTTYQPPALTSSRWYRLKVINTCETGYTGSVKITVHNPLSPGTVTADQTICYNITPAILSVGTAASGGSGSYSYQWQVSSDGASFGDISGATGTNYQPPALTSSRWYRLKVINSCETGYTGSVKITVYNPLSPGTVTADQTICYNITPGILSVGTAASGGSGSYSYQWQVSSDGASFADVSGATGTSYQPPALTSSKWYRLKVINSCETGYTGSVKITVYNLFSPGTVTANQTICYNITPGILNLGTAASGGSGSYSYQWQVSSDGASFGDISGATGTSYQPPALTSSRWYRLKVINSCETGYTGSVKITVYNLFSPGTVTSDQTICYNIAPVLLSVGTVATGGSGTYTYQWQVSTDGSVFGDVNGQIGTTYQPPALTSSKWYKLKVINSCETGYTNTLTTTVRPELIAGTITNSQTICYNTAPALLVTSSLPTGGTGSFTYQWQNSVNNTTWNNITGATAETYSPGAMTSSLYFRRSETSGSCGTVQTNSVHIIVNGLLVAGTVKSDQTICYGTVPGIFITNTYPTGGTGSYSYQWQKLVASLWTDIASANAETYTSGALTSTTYLRRTETSATCGTVISNQITVTVHNQFLAGVIGSSQTVNYGAVPAELVSVQSASGGAGSFSYQWQGSLDNSSWSNISGATSESFQPPALTVKKYFKRLTTDGSCGTIETNVITINVNSLLVPGVIANNQTICYNTTPAQLTTSTAPSGGNGSYLYQWQKTEDGTTWTNITAANSDSYQSGVLIKTTYFRKRVTSVSLDDYTNIVTITVHDNFTAGVIGTDQTVCNNETPASLSSVSLPSGGSGTYTNQWKSSLNSSTWSDVSGATGSYYEPSALTVKTYYKKVVTDLCGVKETNAVTINVNPIFISGTIGNDQTILFNTIPQKLDVSTAASGGTGSFTYQWQRSIDNLAWTNITGATDAFYQPLATSQTTYFKRLTTSGSCGTLPTNIITITVTTEVLVGTIGSSQTICYLTAPALFTTLTGPSAGVVINSQNWMKSEDATAWTDISTATTDIYQSDVLTKTMYFRKKVVTAGNGTIFTNIITITVNPAFAPGTIGNDQAVCKTYASAPITTIVSPVGQSTQNLWQISDNNASWTDITGATNDYYDAGVLTASKYFRKKVTGSCGTGYTNSVKITVNDELQGGTIGIDQAISYNTSPSLLTGTLPTGGSGTFSYQWYYSLNNIDWQVVITGGDGKDYQPGALSQKTYFKRKVTGGSCGEKYSNTITVTVFDTLLPGTVGDAQSICYNSAPAILSGTSPGGGTGQYSYLWQYSLQGVTWVDIVSEAGISYRPDALKVNTYYRRAVTSGNSTVYSNFVMIKVYDQVSLPVTDLKTSYCKGATVNVNIVNPAYLSYKWFDSGHAYLMDGTRYTQNNITSGNTVYIKSLDLNGCLSDYLEQKIMVDNVEAKFTPDITTVNLGDPVKFTSTSVNASTFAWNFFEGDVITEQSPVHYYNVLGVNSKRFNVLLVVKSPGLCIDSLLQNELITVVNPLTGIEPNDEVTFSYYPNPVKEKLYIKGNRSVETVKIFTSEGKLIKSLIFDNDFVFVDFSSLKSGIYFLEINGSKDSKKIIKIIKK